MPAFDYSAGGFFVTICTHERAMLLGDVANCRVALTDMGRIVQEEWLRTADIRPNVMIDEFIIMPNHVHGILIVEEHAEGRRGVLQYAPTPPRRFVSRSQTIGAIIRGFKSTSTTRINTLRQTCRTPIWQRNYYEHIIRDGRDLERIREYIISNPARWSEDEENPMVLMRGDQRS